ncbi:MmcQ/YjbR family DNA-binding protein [Acidaminococcus timonensis]|uniref:MmcQ/YjbR family DNA-binding protein n=1 Tax=Acidaminococcus timonensis TaxID=1871002 RepID=UPI0029429892|nr:MmcQ/YjbR family DNA-binding protein [Acidaminococcus timonensis]
MREKIFEYVKKKYGTEPDYPFRLGRTPITYPVLRHEDNRKIFALFMDVPMDKLGLDGTERVDIINVKIGDPFLADMLSQQTGYYHGYHISRGNWISIRLDGTVPFEDICRWIDESYVVTASKQKRQKMRPPKEWIVPANPKYYDIGHAFDRVKEIDWKQANGIKTGDIVYMYVASPVSAILYKCKVTKTDIPYDYRDGSLTITALMRIRLQKRYKQGKFTFDKLKDEYGIYAIRGPRGIPHSLSEALNN